MSVYSDVALAVKQGINLSPESLEWLNELAVLHVEEEGTLFVIDDVKWYDTDPNVIRLTKELDEQDDDDYLLIQACSEYPGLDNGEGSWNDNPWRLGRVVREELYYEV